MFQQKKWFFLNKTRISRIMKKSYLSKYISLLAFLIFSSDSTAQTNEHVNTDSLIHYLQNSDIKTYTWSIDQNNSWEDLKNALPGLKIAGISINVSLLPPSKTPPINPLGTYSEPFELDFIRWGKEIANLSLRYSNIKGFLIEDIRENISLNYLNLNYIDSIVSKSQSINPKLSAEKLLFSSSTFYVSNNGNDSYTGLSPDSAWATLKKINNMAFAPGDSILFKAGNCFIGGNIGVGKDYPMLAIKSSGTSTSTIYIGSYGSGDKPYFKSNKNVYASAIMISGSYIILNDLKIDSCNFAGFITRGNHITIKNCEIMRCGTGVRIIGQYNLVTHCYIHNAVLSDNVPEGSGGGVGVNITNANNEISYCTIDTCIAPSLAYGSDGGFIEIVADGNIIDNCYIHNNIVRQADNFTEIGGSGTVRNIIFAYNSMYKEDIVTNVGVVVLHIHTTTIQNIKLINNTIYENTLGNNFQHGLISWSLTDTLKPSQLLLYNNIIAGDSCPTITSYLKGLFTGSNNIFYRYDGRNILGFNLDNIGVRNDPILTDVNSYNFIPKSNSPAIGAGLNLGYSYNIISEPVMNPPSIGAY